MTPEIALLIRIGCVTAAVLLIERVHRWIVTGR